MHPWLVGWLRFRDYLSDELGGGSKVVKQSWVINLQKGGTLPFVLAMMVLFDEFSATAWTYAALHGSYGVIWLLKEAIFPDPNWQKKVTVGGAISSFVLVLGLYWLAPILMISQHHHAHPAVLGTAVFVYAVGVVLMIGSDAQKYFVLKQRRGLITDGFFARTRNPNYLGEMLLYASFALLAGHLVPWLVLAWVWGGLFLPNMLRKDASMSRYPEWSAYCAGSGLLLPKLFVRR